MKYLKTVLFIALYAAVYLLFMLVTQMLFGLTLGGAGKILVEYAQTLIASGAQNADPALTEGAAGAAAEIIGEYTLHNTGIIFSISALLSLLVYIRIFAARKLELFSAVGMARKPSGADVRNGAFAGAASNFVISLIVLILQSFSLFGKAFEQYGEQMDAVFGAGGLFASLLGIGVILPVVEEILFRGMILYELGGAMPIKAAIIAQGVIFGLFHLDPIQIFYTLPLGVYFGYMAYKTGSLWPAVAAHVAMNTVSTLLSAPAMANIFSQPQIFLFITLLSLYLFAGSLAYFIKKEPARDTLAKSG